jgi:hypothetical protein
MKIKILLDAIGLVFQNWIPGRLPWACVSQIDTMDPFR